MSTQTYLHHADEVERMLRHLESLSFSVKSLWLEHRERLEKEQSARPHEDDLLYLCPLTAPTIDDHCCKGQKQTLTSANAFKGYSYTLTPGQRQWLGEQFGMTPTATVTILELGLWPDSQHPRQLTLASDEHVDARRKHVLSKVTINQPGRFFREAQQLDTLILEHQPRAGIVTSVLSQHVVNVTAGGTLLEKVMTPQITTLEVGDNVMIKWANKRNRETRQYDEYWTVTRRLSPSKAQPSDGAGRSSVGFHATPSLDAMLDELVQFAQNLK